MQQSLNQLCLTAIGRTWESFAETLASPGYVPTIMEYPTHSAEKNAAKRELADRLEALGYTVWRGSRAQA